MLHRTKLLASALAIVAGLSSAAPAPHLVRHKEFCAGTIDAVDPDTMFFSGEGRATHFGKYTIVGSHNFDGTGAVTNGQFVSEAADGSTLEGVYAGTFTPLPDGSVRFDVFVEWLVGTGRFEDVTGEGTTVAILDAPVPGGKFEYITTAVLEFP